MSTRTLSGLALAAALVILPACDEDDPTPSAPEPEPTADLVQVAEDAGSFQTLLSAVEAAGLTATLQGAGPFTVFAPTDDAFGRITDETLGGIVADADRLSELLTYHVVAGDVDAAGVAASSTLGTLSGGELQVAVDGGRVFLNGVEVIQTDIEASNGIIHVVDGVLVPAGFLTIVELARENGSFGTLLTALEVAGLAETLQEGGPFTVFAPTDDAFAELPSQDLDALLNDPAALADVLLYHVVAGRVPAADVVGLDSAETLNGASVSIEVVDGQVRVDGATVVATDLEASNGLVHVVDQVLLPPTS